MSFSTITWDKASAHLQTFLCVSSHSEGHMQDLKLFPKWIAIAAWPLPVEGRLQWSAALVLCDHGLELCVVLLVVLVVSKSHSILLFNGIWLKSTCVACGYKVSSTITFNRHEVKFSCLCCLWL